MVCDLEATTFDGQVVWRVGRAPTPWRFTNWAYADQHGRFDGRWDDPDGSYRVLYASMSKFGAFVEALGDFRADPHLAPDLQDIATQDGEPGAVPPGQLPVSWLRGRVTGEATVTAPCAHVGHSRSLACLRRQLATLVVRHKLEDLDGAAIRLRAPRAFTQHVSRFVYECTDEDGAAQFHGIHYLSRFGDDLASVALFELPTGGEPVSAGTSAPVGLDDPALQEAMQHHGLTWFDDTAT